MIETNDYEILKITAPIKIKISKFEEEIKKLKLKLDSIRIPYRGKCIHSLVDKFEESKHDKYTDRARCLVCNQLLRKYSSEKIWRIDTGYDSRNDYFYRD